MPPTALFSVSQMAAILARLPDPAFVLTRSGRYVAILGGTDSRYYHDGSQLIGKTIGEVLVPDKAAWFLEEIAGALASGCLHVVEYGLHSSDVSGLGADGPDETMWFEGRVQALDFQIDGEDVVLWVASNISARHTLEGALRTQGEVDELSGLHNRRKLMAALAAQYDSFARYATPAALMIFDIDHFKAINDQFGHPAGDRTIAAIAAICRSELRAPDLAARYGGDEFVVLMPHTSARGAATIAQRLRARVEQELNVEREGGLRISISAGVSEFQAGDPDYEALLQRADKALYRAKHAGRNGVFCHCHPCPGERYCPAADTERCQVRRSDI
ncbi:GGDEF domain-containing protein [Massilia sp. TS11]|uniref:GGDEF domain-containing protein n=1 Tax=Massilia sp. TS11 TaxID=2908003 RepID=UPI001EDAE0AF|nr:GGDEF domain-containing protein [Massilia sp. TS11]MCG2585008.1 GGDEF domain-containing protein [Massilia sp. TS11]